MKGENRSVIAYSRGGDGGVLEVKQGGGVRLLAGLAGAVFLAPTAGAAVQYRVEILRNLSSGTTSTTARAVNDSGVVVGDAERDGFFRVPPVRWDLGASAPTELGFFKSENGFGWGINNSGDAVGQLQGAPTTAAVWPAGGTSVIALPSFSANPNGDNVARAISDTGWVVGSSAGAGAARWATFSTAPVSLRAPGGGLATAATAVNNHGDAVGSAHDSSTGQEQAVLWQAGGTTGLALPRLPASGGLVNLETVAYGINDAGWIVGLATMYSGTQPKTQRAVRWSPDGSTIVDLGSGFATGINSAGDAVGLSSPGATLWTEDLNVTVDLNTVIAPDSGWNLLFATDISDTGFIIGQGTFDPDGAGPLTPVTAAFRLVPVPEPAGVVGLGLSGWIVLRRRRRQSVSGR